MKYIGERLRTFSVQDFLLVMFKGQEDNLSLCCDQISISLMYSTATPLFLQSSIFQCPEALCPELQMHLSWR